MHNAARNNVNIFDVPGSSVLNALPKPTAAFRHFLANGVIPEAANTHHAATESQKTPLSSLPPAMAAEKAKQLATENVASQHSATKIAQKQDLNTPRTGGMGGMTSVQTPGNHPFPVDECSVPTPNVLACKLAADFLSEYDDSDLTREKTANKALATAIGYSQKLFSRSKGLFGKANPVPAATTAVTTATPSPSKWRQFYDAAKRPVRQTVDGALLGMGADTAYSFMTGEDLMVPGAVLGGVGALGNSLLRKRRGFRAWQGGLLSSANKRRVRDVWKGRPGGNPDAMLPPIRKILGYGAFAGPLGQVQQSWTSDTVPGGINYTQPAQTAWRAGVLQREMLARELGYDSFADMKGDRGMIRDFVRHLRGVTSPPQTQQPITPKQDIANLVSSFG